MDLTCEGSESTVVDLTNTDSVVVSLGALSMQIMMYALAVLIVLITISFCHCLKTEMLTFYVSIFFSTTA